jgi:hypothetical protein
VQNFPRLSLIRELVLMKSRGEEGEAGSSLYRFRHRRLMDTTPATDSGGTYAQFSFLLKILQCVYVRVLELEEGD